MVDSAEAQAGHDDKLRVKRQGQVSHQEPVDDRDQEAARALDKHDAVARRQAVAKLELLLVLVILGILASLILPKFSGRTEQARMTAAQVQESGPCRDLNFDPLTLPNGIESTNDPVLHARSAAYSVSFNRREREISAGKAPALSNQTGSPK